MSTSGWSASTTSDEAYRRASGRRAYNARRQSAALERRIQVARAFTEIVEEEGLGVLGRGVQARLARKFNVSRSTMTRDTQFLWRWLAHRQCPSCDTMLTAAQYEALERAGRLPLHRQKPVDLTAMARFTTFMGRQRGGDRSRLTEEWVLQAGGWSARARVLGIVEDNRLALAVVDNRGDGADIWVTFWRLDHGTWMNEAVGELGALTSFTRGRWCEGPLAWAVGRSDPNRARLVQYRGQHHVCRPSEFGFWIFARRSDPEDDSRPELVG